jgi:DNA gyrase subunit A
MLISSTGTLVRTPVDEISVVGRNTQGVRLIRLGEGERLVGVERVDETLEGEPAEGEGSAPTEAQPSEESSEESPPEAPQS